jgi:hypothetical protein
MMDEPRELPGADMPPPPEEEDIPF